MKSNIFSRASRLFVTMTCLILFVLISPLFGQGPKQNIKIQIPMPDGINLEADFFRSSEEKASPVILIRTPYGKQQHSADGEFFAKHGYNVIIQDTRGKWKSEGDFFPFINEQKDGMATLDWITKQDWCNGQIGMWGSSYLSFSALILGSSQHPALVSIFAISGWLGGSKMISPGGAFHLQLSLPWMLYEATQKTAAPISYDIDELFSYLPMNEVFQHLELDGELWNLDKIKNFAPKEILDPARIKIPVFHITGWYDFVHDASLDNYMSMYTQGNTMNKLMVGPWFHDQFQSTYSEVGDEDFGSQSVLGSKKANELALRWFDFTIKKIDNGIDEEPPVDLFVMGDNQWQEFQEFPPKETSAVNWYLSSNSGANSRAGDGMLSLQAKSKKKTDSYIYDPNNPVPTYGGANFHFFLHTIGVKDQRDIENREDVLVYTSEILENDLDIIGGISATIYASTEGRDTDFTAKLVEVYPDGYARNIVEGITRASFRNGTDKRELLVPGKVYPISVDMGNTAINIKKGHQIRLEISSSNFPKYDRNPNTGEDPFTTTELRSVNQKIFMGDKYPSHLSLPIFSGKKSEQKLVSVTSEEKATTETVDQTIKKYKNLVKTDPDNSDYQLKLGEAYFTKLKTASFFEQGILSGRALDHLNKAIKLNPANIQAHMNLASYYQNAPAIAGGSDKKAQFHIEEALKYNPGDSNLLYQLGTMYQHMGEHTGDYEKAFEAFENSLNVDPKAYLSLYQIGKTSVLSKTRLDLGLASFNEYLQHEQTSPNPGHDAAYWRMGMIHEIKQDFAEAKTCYEKALILVPGSEKYQLALQSLNK